MGVVKNVKFYPDQWKIIEQYVKDKDVLDIGAVAHSTEMAEKSGWLHGRIAKVAKYVIGVDIEKEEVDILRKKGWNMICGNAETVDLGRTYDIVMVGDTIAQISNPGLFLDNMHRHLKGGGVMIITTLNLLCWWTLRDMFFERKGYIDVSHTINYYEVNSLTHLLSRHKFNVKEIYYTDSGNHLFCKYFPKLSDSFVVTAKKE